MKTKTPRRKNLQKKTLPNDIRRFFPQDPLTQKILHERTQHIAKLAIDKVEQIDAHHYIRFRLGENEHYGIPYQYAKEVMNSNSITKVPCAPSFIAGTINHRGTLIGIIDLKQFFYQRTTEFNKNAGIIVISGNDITIGILADIEGSDAYHATSLNPSLPTEGLIKPEYILGLHQGITAIINVEAVLLDVQLQMG